MSESLVTPALKRVNTVLACVLVLVLLVIVVRDNEVIKDKNQQQEQSSQTVEIEQEKSQQQDSDSVQQETIEQAPTEQAMIEQTTTEQAAELVAITLPPPPPAPSQIESEVATATSKSVPEVQPPTEVAEESHATPTNPEYEKPSREDMRLLAQQAMNRVLALHNNNEADHSATYESPESSVPDSTEKEDDSNSRVALVTDDLAVTPAARPNTPLISDRASEKTSDKTIEETSGTISEEVSEEVSEEATVTQPNREQIAEGRALLRQLETGQGPAIVIAWPESSVAQEKLYLALKRQGMVTALLDKNNGIWRSEGSSNQRWNVNRDRYSGFMRLIDGQVNSLERNELNQIKQHHSNALARHRNQVEAVRLFPRQLDAKLLAGLDTLLGQTYAQASQIRARYEIAGDAIVVNSITADGRKIAGAIRL